MKDAKPLETTLTRVMHSELRRERVGPFFGQILANTSCQWESSRYKPAFLLFKERIEELETERVRAEIKV